MQLFNPQSICLLPLTSALFCPQQTRHNCTSSPWFRSPNQGSTLKTSTSSHLILSLHKTSEMTWLRKWPNYNNQGLNNSGRIMLWLWRVVFLVPLAQTTKTNVIDNFASRPRLYILQTMFILVASKPVFNNLGWYIFFLSCLFLFMDLRIKMISH